MNPNTFDEASEATRDMFAADAENQAGGEADTSGSPTPGSEAPDAAGAAPDNAAENSAQSENAAAESLAAEAAQTAETAAEAAAQKASELQDALSELESLRAQNRQLQGTIDELSNKNAGQILEEVLTPPELDVSAIAFEDDAAQKAALADYTAKLTEYNRKQLMRELTPTLEYARRGMEAEKAEAVINELAGLPELADIRGMKPELDRIIENNKWLKSEDMPLEEKYINAYAVARGIDSINHKAPAAPASPTPEEMLERYNSDPAFRELIEKQRLSAVAPSQQVPPFSASSGAANAALNIKDKPKTLEEASRRTREMFGGE